MELQVLGPLAVVRGGLAVDHGGPKQAALLAALALHLGRVVSTDALVDLVWGESPPASVTGTLQAYVAGLRRVLEPDRAPRTAPTVLLTSGAGYLLRLPGTALDAVRAESAVSQAGALLGPLVHELTGPPEQVPLAQARALLDEVAGLWRGVPYADLGDRPGVAAERARLDELRATAAELQALVRLAEGDASGAAGELERLTRLHPLRERLWALRVLALTRAGRQADALAALREVRRLLADELGLDPGAELRRLEEAVLRQDPALHLLARPSLRIPAQSDPTGPAASPAADPSPASCRGPTPGAASTALAALATSAADPHLRPVPSVGSTPNGSVAPSGAEPAPGPAPSAAPGGSIGTHPWPLVGRAAAVEQLLDLLGRAEQGLPQAAVLVGEPGIGKSRLCAELARLARARGAEVRVGRCSQDDGAPPLWPWASVLDGLDGAPDLHAHLQSQGTDPADGFSTWEAVRRAVVGAARIRTLVVVLDDLHWSDPSSLRVLRHLLDTASTARLLVVATWRSHPAPTGRLAEAAESLARASALRLELQGLSAPETAALVAAVVGERPSDTDAESLSRRTDGNPFFLVEYARLLAASDDPSAALADEPPPAVADVLRRRLDGLDDATTAVLRAAAVLGRAFSLDVLVPVSGRSDVDVLDALDPALATGLVVEDGVDRFRFAHALVRDAVLAAVPLSRRARLHARAGEALDAPATRTEAARHWLAAGPASAGRAWRTAADAARAASALHAVEEARDLLRDALAAQEQDASSTWTDRYDLLMALADASRRVPDWDRLTQAVDEAVEVAERAGDVERAARAAVQPTVGALWQARSMGVVHEPNVAALRRALEALPPGDGDLRCRALCALAQELYYRAAPLEREALTEQALAMARRLGDPALLQAALQMTFSAVWRPSSAPRRLALAEEAAALARATADEPGLATALTLQAVVLGELGAVDRMCEVLERARELAARLRLPYLLIVLGCLHAPWLAMRGRDAEADALLEEVRRLAETSSLPQSDDGVTGAALVTRVHQGDDEAVGAGMQALAQRSEMPLTSVLCAVLLRLGRPDLAREVLGSAQVDLDADDWFALLTWCTACEVAAGLELPELGAAAYARALPYAGRTAVAGSGGPLGPVDAFLALAAAAAGELETARRHADDAERLCRTWRVPRVAQWLRDARDRHGI